MPENLARIPMQETPSLETTPSEGNNKLRAALERSKARNPKTREITPTDRAATDALSAKKTPSLETTPSTENDKLRAGLKKTEARNAEKQKQALETTPSKENKTLRAALEQQKIKSEQRQKQENALLYDIDEAVSVIEICSQLNPKFSPSNLVDALQDLALYEKIKKPDSLKKVEAKYKLPEGMLEKYKTLTEKIGTQNFMKMIKIFNDSFKKIKSEKLMTPSLETISKKIERVSQIFKTSPKAPEMIRPVAKKITQQEQITQIPAEKASEAPGLVDSILIEARNKNLIDSVLKNKMTADFAFDLTAEERKMLLDHASVLANKSDTAGAEFYNKLKALNLHETTAQPSDVMARFRDRASSVESTSAGITSGSETRESSSSLVSALDRPKTNKFASSSSENYDLKPEPVAKKGFFGRLKEFFGGKKVEDKVQARATKEQKARYSPKLKALEKTGKTFGEALVMAELHKEDAQLITDIMTGQKGEVSDQEITKFNQAFDQVMKSSGAQPENKTLDALADIYIDLAEQIGATNEHGTDTTIARRMSSRAKRIIK